MTDTKKPAAASAQVRDGEYVQIHRDALRNMVGEKVFSDLMSACVYPGSKQVREVEPVAFCDAEEIENVANVVMREGSFGCHVPLFYGKPAAEPAPVDARELGKAVGRWIEPVPVAQGDDKLLDMLIEGAKALGHHSVLRESDDATIEYWRNYVEDAKAKHIADHARREVALRDAVEDAETELAVLRPRLAAREASLAACRALPAVWRRRAAQEDETGELEQEAGSVTRLNLCADELEAVLPLAGEVANDA